ncbi:hypothetical protein TNIN_326761 [Trichonephila inaurata madagascariensis]|uniref:Uncharacterized protein n=1 Tax=Trichonephila inaurata madagascariensis TaxID=2747483 RepID=A0A8X6XZ15_9ARAC|nr:hypothetical protein TNIN_326761 [Trichonephila inaurata madagascariensis]
MLFEPHYEKLNQEPENCVYIYEPERQTTQRIITPKDSSKMYVPHRNESELIVDYDTGRESFLARLEIFRERDRQLGNSFNQIHAFKVLNQDAHQETFEEELEMPEQHGR